MRDTFIRILSKRASKDRRIILITGDLGFGVLDDFAHDFPDQYINAGVAEQNMTGLATGLALEGKIVFTYSIANFPILRCLEQIRNDAAYHKANVKIVSIGAGFSYGSLGMSHHATEDLAIMRAIPQITVVSPACLWEVEEATNALIDTPGTCYLRLDKSNAGHTQSEKEHYELGEIRTLRDGKDITLITTGGILAEVLTAAAQLADEGIQCRVLNIHTLRPLNADVIFRAARETGGFITVEEHTVDGGLGGLIAETCMEANIVPRAFARLGIRGGFCSIVGSQSFLRSQYGLDAGAIATSVRNQLK